MNYDLLVCSHMLYTHILHALTTVNQLNVLCDRRDLCFQNVQHLGPATDFYKKLALDCSGQQIGVDLFLLSSQYADLASLGNIYI